MSAQNERGADVSAGDDPYAVLGVEPSASAAEIRRSFRRLALRLHPDRAGASSTGAFQRVARAYALLANETARRAHDAVARLRAASTPARAEARPGVAVIARLAAPLRTLLERGIARERPDGVVELLLTREEARAGGHAALGVPLRVPCPTCGGCAARDRVWCLRCEFEGVVADVVTALIAIPAGVHDGVTFTIPLDDAGGDGPLRVCLRLA
jgi:DnaJ-class molecular chaperone